MNRIAQKIRDAFPSPERYDEGSGREGSYCVGGAFLKALKGEGANLFPEVGELAYGLAQFAGWSVEDEARMERADRVAGAIIDHNDAGEFGAAWGWLGKFITGAKSKLGKTKSMMLSRLKGLPS